MSYKILCSLPNASLTIDGLEWREVKGGVEIVIEDKDQADKYASIPGYTVSEDKLTKKAATATAKE